MTFSRTWSHANLYGAIQIDMGTRLDLGLGPAAWDGGPVRELPYDVIRDGSAGQWLYERPVRRVDSDPDTAG
jgi:hypothetical protein